MTKEKLNDLLDKIVKNSKEIMDDLNEIIQDKNKKADYFAERLSEDYSCLGRMMGFYNRAKKDMDREQLPEVFGVDYPIPVLIEGEKSED